MDTSSSTLQFGSFTLEPGERLLRRDGEPVPLTPKAVDVLVALVERPGRLVSREELLQEVWRDTFVEEANLSYNIFTLRKALGDTADSPTYIETIPKRGYRFKAPVSLAPGNHRPSQAHTEPADAGAVGSRSVLLFPEPPPPRQFEGTAVLKTATPHVVAESSSMAAEASGRRSSLGRNRVVVVVAAAALIAVSYSVWRWGRASVNDVAPHAVPLTSVPGVVHSPSLSPDGNYVAFTWSGPNGDNIDIYVQQIGAGSPHRLTSDPDNDYGPSWSPDGLTIAFLRRGPAGQIEAWRIAPLGGTERKLADIRPQRALLRPDALSWCPDSSCVLVTDSGIDERDAVFAIAVETGQKRQLTYPRGLVRDSDAAISPDGRHLIFRRDTTPLSGQFFRVSLKTDFTADGEPQPVTPILNAGRASWMPDSREILFASHGALWRLDTLGGGTPMRLPFVGQDGGTPVVARTAEGRQRLVYVRSLTDSNVWRIDVAAAGAAASSPPAIAIASTRTDAIASVSPDARQLAFLSNRSGDPQIWVARHDGSDAFALTSLAFRSTPGFPRWSPDGRHVAFHGDPDGRPDAFVVPAAGGDATLLMKNAAFPTYSANRQWIYVSSADQRGDLRIFKIPAGGGNRVQVTDNAGTRAIESHDGDLYYVDTVDRPGSLWKLPAAAAPAVKILEGIVLGNFDVVDRGIYYVDRGTQDVGELASDKPGGETRLRYFDFATQKSTTVAVGLGTVSFGLSATRDGRTVYFSRVDSKTDELMVVDDFR